MFKYIYYQPFCHLAIMEIAKNNFISIPPAEKTAFDPIKSSKSTANVEARNEPFAV